MLAEEPQVLVHAAWHVADPPVKEGELVVGHALHEVAVVTHEQERAGPSVQKVLEHGQHVGVEVVAGLVQDEDVGLLHEDAHDGEAAALATRDLAHEARELATVEAQALEQLLGALLPAVHHVVALVAREELLDPPAVPLGESPEVLREDAEAH